MQERHHTGLDYLEAVTTLTRRIRSAHPTAGFFEAADFQWRWRKPRSTDEMPQLFWYDDEGPAAASIAADWGDGASLDPILLPDAPDEWRAHVVARGLTHAAELGLSEVDVVVDASDDAMFDILGSHGLTERKPETVEAWIDGHVIPSVSDLHTGYLLLARSDVPVTPHHMVKRNGEVVEERLLQTSLYRPDLDLVVLDNARAVAAYGLFWFDPVTRTGLVEPMRTEDDHQRLGLARHVLTSGLDRLVAAGADRIKICFEPDNPAAKTLYLGVGFEPIRQCSVVSRPG